MQVGECVGATIHTLREQLCTVFFLLHRWILEHRSPGFRSPYLKVFIFEVLGIKPRASHILDKYSTTDEDWD